MSLNSLHNKDAIMLKIREKTENFTLEEEIFSLRNPYPFDLDKIDEKDAWNVDEIFSNPMDLSSQLSQMESNSNLVDDASWDAVNAWLFDSDDNGTKDVKEEPISPHYASSSSISSENEADNGLMMNLQSGQQLHPDSYITQTISTSDLNSFQQALSPVIGIINKGTGATQILNGNNQQFVPGVNQYNVYKKFIPIKPKEEKQDVSVRSPIQQDTIAQLNATQHFQARIGVKEEKEKHPKKRGKLDNDDIEHKIARKQKRMARNRESALNSRQKKKEVMQTLEVRLNALTSINSQLKFENDALKNKVMHLELENSDLKTKKQVDIPDLAKKTSCVLVLFVFIAINMKPISKLTSNSLDASAMYSSPIRHGRYLLEFDKQRQTNDHVLYQNVVYDREAAKQSPPEGLTDILDRSISRKIKRLNKARDNFKREQLALAVQESQMNKLMNETVEDPDCASSYNKTEVYRLNEALERLVKVHKKTATKSKKKKKTKKQDKVPAAFKALFKHSIDCNNDNKNHTSNCSKNTTKTESKTKPLMQLKMKRPENPLPKTNEVQPFQFDWSVLERFQKSINRQPNTFYFVSFRKDHILLPPLQLNDTQRPRVSFILPSSNSNHSSWNSTSDKLSLMQIDCQVMDTKIFHIPKRNIPENYLPLNKFSFHKT